MPIYSDLNQKKITSVLLTDVQCIYQSLDNIFNTVPGQRLFLPDFGTNEEGLLFELMTDTTAFGVLNEMVAPVRRWEPRVDVLFGQSSVNPDYDKHFYDGTIVLQVPEISSQQFEFNFLVKPPGA